MNGFESAYLDGLEDRWDVIAFELLEILIWKIYNSAHPSLQTKRFVRDA